MSTISSGTTLTTALVQTGDTTGDLVIKTGSSNTTAMTISGTDQSVTIVGTLTANLSAINASSITSGVLAVANGGTNAATASDARTNLGLVIGTNVLAPNGSGASLTNVVNSITGTSNQVTASASTGAVTLSLPQSIATTSSVQFGSFGVGTAASGTTGEIRATNNITAYYSDARLKTKIGSIENALEKVKQIDTMVYHANETAVELGYDASKIEVGVTAQSVQKVQPEAVKPAPIDEKYLTVQYERLVPLLIEAIKELEEKVAKLEAK